MRFTSTLSVLGFAAFMLPAVASAGPCSDQIAELGRKLAQSPALGPVTTGTLSGAAPGSIPTPAPGGTAPAPVTTGTSADNRVGGTAATKELNAAAASVATSADDVRRQQQGLPTAAQVAAAGSGRSVETTPGQGSSPKPDDRMSQAKMELERARMLDQKDDRACSASIDRTRQLMGS